MAQNGNMRKFGPTNPNGTAFAPKQWLYQKKGTGMESSNMYCHCRRRYCTYQCGAANYLVLWGVVYGPEWNNAKFRTYQSPWCRVCTKEIVISKERYGHGQFKNVLPESLQIPYLPVRCRKLPRFIDGSIGSRLEICGISALPIPMVPRLH